MHISSLIISIILHLAVFACILYVPVKPPIDLLRPVVKISLVTGAPGGENLPSPVLGHRPPVTGKQVNTLNQIDKPKAEPILDASVPETPEIPKPQNLLPEQQNLPKPQEIQQAPEVKPISKPEPNPEQPKEPSQEPLAIPKNPEQKKENKPEPKKEQKPEAKQEKKPSSTSEQQPKKSSDAKNNTGKNALADALADVRKQVKSSGNSGGGSSASRALADLQKQVSQKGIGGGGGEGDGPGGGGIYDVYVGLVINAIRPNWSMPVYSRTNMQVTVRIKLDKNGNILDQEIINSSGRPEFDGSAMNAIKKTKQLPKPPTSAQQDLVITFNSLEMMGR